MKKQDETDDELRLEYDLSQVLKGAMRGKYASRYREGKNLVRLDPDVAAAFPNEETVNAAWRLVLQRSKIPAASQ